MTKSLCEVYLFNKCISFPLLTSDLIPNPDKIIKYITHLVYKEIVIQVSIISSLLSLLLLLLSALTADIFFSNFAIRICVSHWPSRS